MYVIEKRLTFAASHVLDGLPDGHPCGRLHGHNWELVLVLATADDALDPPGFVRDFTTLTAFKDHVARLDHRHLNDVMPGQPTSEHLARWTYAAMRLHYPETAWVWASEGGSSRAGYGDPVKLVGLSEEVAGFAHAIRDGLARDWAEQDRIRAELEARP